MERAAGRSGPQHWERGGWATVMILFQDRARDGEGWRPAKLALIRLRRAGEGWKKHAQLTLPADHARGLAETLAEHAAQLAEHDDDDHA